jgi:hypothetical protein
VAAQERHHAIQLNMEEMGRDGVSWVPFLPSFSLRFPDGYFTTVVEECDRLKPAFSKHPLQTSVCRVFL